jgi:arylsulfatase A-like enzyme
MTDRPNILFIITDQHKADHLGCYGNTIVQTPNIDGLAADGVVFDRFYTASPICMPNRSTLMTSRMPSRHGVRLNGLPLSKDNVTFVELLRDAGYQTAMIGKCHLQPMMDIPLDATEYWPENLSGQPPPDELKYSVRIKPDNPEYDQERAAVWLQEPSRQVETPYYGFDYLRFANFHSDLVHGHYTKWLDDRHENPKSIKGPDNALQDDAYSVKKGWRTSMPEELYPTTYVANETISYLEKHAERDSSEPFFLQCSFPDPHAPLTPPGHYWSMYTPENVELPASFDHVDEHEPLFVSETRASHGQPKKVPSAYTPDEKEAREMIALTYGMVTMVDDAIGNILNALDDLELRDNTIIVFTADHGDMGGEHGFFGKFGVHYEAVLKVPFIWCDPDVSDPSRSDRLGGTIDIGPTILGRVGLANSIGMQGVNVFAPSTQDNQHAREGIFAEEDQLSAQVNDMGPQRIWTFIKDQWRLSIWYGDETGQLYDRSNDPHEMNNLWFNPEYASVKGDLMESMMRERMHLGETLPLPKRFA